MPCSNEESIILNRVGAIDEIMLFLTELVRLSKPELDLFLRHCKHL